MSARVCTCVHACVELTWNRQTHRAYTRCGICVYTRSHIRIYTQRQYSGVHTCVCLGACCARARARSRSVHTTLRTLRTTFSHRGAPQRFRRYSRPRVSGNVLPPLRSDRPFGRRVCVCVCASAPNRKRAPTAHKDRRRRRRICAHNHTTAHRNRVPPPLHQIVCARSWFDFVPSASSSVRQIAQIWRHFQGACACVRALEPIYSRESRKREDVRCVCVCVCEARDCSLRVPRMRARRIVRIPSPSLRAIKYPNDCVCQRVQPNIVHTRTRAIDKIRRK